VKLPQCEWQAEEEADHSSPSLGDGGKPHSLKEYEDRESDEQAISRNRSRSRRNECAASQADLLLIGAIRRRFGSNDT